MGFNGSEFRENLAAITGQTMQLAFPGMRDAFRAIEEAAVEAIHVRAKEQELEDLFKGMRGEGGVLLGGRQRRNGSSEYAELDALSSRNSILNDILLQNVVLSLEEQIQLLDDEIAALEEEIAVIDNKLLAIEEIRELRASGKLDLSDPEHRALLRQAGVDPDEDEADLDFILSSLEQRLEAERLGKVEELRERERRRETIASNLEQIIEDGGVYRDAEGRFATPEIEQAVQMTERTVGTYDQENIEHQKLLAQNIVTMAAYARRNELALTANQEGIAVNESAVAELGISDFRQRYAETQNIVDDQARLAAQKAIFDDINEKGMSFAFAAASDEELRTLFEPNHFENLREVQTAANSTLESNLTAQV